MCFARGLTTSFDSRRPTFCQSAITPFGWRQSLVWFALMLQTRVLRVVRHHHHHYGLHSEPSRESTRRQRSSRLDVEPNNALLRVYQIAPGGAVDIPILRVATPLPQPAAPTGIRRCAQCVRYSRGRMTSRTISILPVLCNRARSSALRLATNCVTKWLGCHCRRARRKTTIATRLHPTPTLMFPDGLGGVHLG